MLTSAKKQLSIKDRFFLAPQRHWLYVRWD